MRISIISACGNKKKTLQIINEELRVYLSNLKSHFNTIISQKQSYSFRSIIIITSVTS